MKIRNGFVSNSSSSSFVVIRKDYPRSGEKSDVSNITPKEERLLQKFGFKKVSCFYARQVDIALYYEGKDRKNTKKVVRNIFGDKEKNIPEIYNYGYYVVCNQDDVIYFLLKNNIPFEASCHYGHETIIYARGAKDFIVVQNFGEQMSMYQHWDNEYKEVFKKFCKEEPIKKYNVEEWLKQNEKWHKQ